jgi:PAS domain S-box-containing protein
MNEDWRFDELHPDAYRLLVEGVPALLYIDRPDRRSTNLYTSPHVEELLGYAAEEWSNDPELWRRSLHPEDAERVLEANRVSNERGERFLAEYRLRARDGRWVWVRDEAIPMAAPDGTLVFWRGVMLDITDRKEAEDEGRLAQERLRALIDNIPAVVYVETPDASAERFFLSGYVETLFGYTAEEWTWTDDFWIDRIHPDDRDAVLAVDAASDASRGPYAIDYRFRAADGRWVWVHDEASFVDPEEGDGFWQGFMFDITERKEGEGRLRWSLDVLRQTLQQRRELAQRVQHAQEEERRRIAADLHDDPIQVMSAVDMRLQMLAGFPDSVSSDELAALELDVRGAIERLRSMLFELRPAALDIEGLVPALEQYLEHVASSTGWLWEVQGHVVEEPDADVRALLYRIAQEAIQNARKHAGATQLRVDVATAGDGVSVRIHDDGAGFDPDEASRPEPGHLGMSAMLESAELAGGWVRVASSFGEGTTVECWLPFDATTEGVSEDA